MEVDTELISNWYIASQQYFFGAMILRNLTSGKLKVDGEWCMSGPVPRRNFQIVFCLCAHHTDKKKKHSLLSQISPSYKDHMIKMPLNGNIWRAVNI